MTVMNEISRRGVLTGALAGAGLAAVGQNAFATPTAPAFAPTRGTLPSGVQSGDVTTKSAYVWARSSVPGRMIVSIPAGRSGERREVRGPWANPDNDFTATMELTGLQAGRDYTYAISFEDEAGRRGEAVEGHFATASDKAAATSFVWTGDTAGQGWGINPDLGGMVAYKAMQQTKPAFFIHSGDNIYGDNPILPEVKEPDGQIWRNIVTPEVSKVAETLKEFRGRYRYNQMDKNILAMYADVPVFSQWDDHETRNNWYPGQILDDQRYAEKQIDVLVARARQAFRENMPMPSRIHRTINRGAMLEVFMLDMRSFRGTNTPGLETERTPFLGTGQVDWLLKELKKSKATWKVIAADMPIGIIVPDGPVNIEAIANREPGNPKGREIEIAYLLQQIKKQKIRNVVWLTADVHYCATHYYDPAKAAFNDFDPFYEFVAGPISAGAFGPGDMDATFGPQVKFQGVPRYQNQSPRDQKAMFFGHVAIDANAVMTVSLRNGLGEIVHTTKIDPAS